MDAHNSPKAADWIAGKGREYDAVIVGGDLGGRGSHGYAEQFLKAAASTGRIVLYVPGNADSPDAEMPAGVLNLHGRRSRLGRHVLGGLGGSSPTPFRTPFEMEDREARAILSRLGGVDVLVSHCPPLDTMCDLAGARHVGSLPVREYVLATGPNLVLSGHAHESRGTDTIGRTVVVNPGPILDGNYAEVEFDPEIRVELKSSEM